MRAKKFLAMAIALGLAVGATVMPTLAADKKTFVFGDTTFNAENEEACPFRHGGKLFLYQSGRAYPCDRGRRGCEPCPGNINTLLPIFGFSLFLTGYRKPRFAEIGRASCRERV